MKTNARKNMKLNIISLVKKDHKPLKECIAVLKNAHATAKSKKKVLAQFLESLSRHAFAEERALYSAMELKGGMDIDVIGALQEHKIAHTLAKELEEIGTHGAWSDELSAKSRILAELVGNHIREEERKFLPLVKKHSTDEELGRMAERYNEFYAEKFGTDEISAYQGMTQHNIL
jgi:hemerythrin-like domain-containing protein